VLNCFQVIWFQDLTFIILYSYFSSIKMSKNKVCACQRFNQCNFFLHEEICPFPLEDCVRNFLDLNDYISTLSIRNFIPFSMNCILLKIWSTLINLNFQFLFLLLYFLAFACFALFRWVNNFSFPFTVITWSCTLSIHTRPHHSHDSLHSFPLAPFTFLHCFGISSSNSFTFCTDSLTIYFKLKFFSII